MHIYIYIFTSIHTYVYIYTHICPYIFIYTLISEISELALSANNCSTHVVIDSLSLYLSHTCTHMYIYIHVHMQYMHINICTHTHTYIYIYIPEMSELAQWINDAGTHVVIDCNGQVSIISQISALKSLYIINFDF